MGFRGWGVASAGRADRGTTSRLQRDGEHFDNSDVYVLDMSLELAAGASEAMKNGLHIGWLVAAHDVQWYAVTTLTSPYIAWHTGETTLPTIHTPTVMLLVGRQFHFKCSRGPTVGVTNVLNGIQVSGSTECSHGP